MKQSQLPNLRQHFSEKDLDKSKEIFNLLFKGILEIWDFLSAKWHGHHLKLCFLFTSWMWRLSESQAEDQMPNSRCLVYLCNEISPFKVQRPHLLNGSGTEKVIENWSVHSLCDGSQEAEGSGPTSAHWMLQCPPQAAAPCQGILSPHTTSGPAGQRLWMHLQGDSMVLRASWKKGLTERTEILSFASPPKARSTSFTDWRQIREIWSLRQFELTQFPFFSHDPS